MSLSISVNRCNFFCNGNAFVTENWRDKQDCREELQELTEGKSEIRSED